MKCSICGYDIEPDMVDGKVAWDQGHNAAPVNDGRCCTTCNYTIVVPRRIKDCFNDNKTEQRSETSSV